MKKPSPAPNGCQARVLPPLEVLDGLLKLDHKTGVLIWRVNRTGGIRAGDVAGSLNTSGYTKISILGVMYVAHRIAWKLYYRTEPPDVLDHRNGMKSDNRPKKNLRPATRALNSFNQKTPKSNVSGVKGVHYEKRIRKWRAQIMVGGKTIHLGSHATIEEADAAVRAARKKYHGKFANHG